MKERPTSLTVPDVPRDAPLRLSRAAEIAFPDGGMTASGLRREASKGRLTIERIAGKDFTTLEAIDEMRKLCRREPSAASDAPQTSDVDVARAAALEAANKLKKLKPYAP
jgi:hypothetical protein